MQKEKLVIFDLDGTLFRTETVDVEAFNRALSTNGYNCISEKEVLDLIGLVMDDICKLLLGSVDKDLINKFKNDVIRFEDEAITGSGELYPGVLEFLERLKSKGFSLSICSNGNEEYVNGVADKFGFHTLFDEIWFEKTGISKAQAVAIIKKKFNAGRFVMVGDRLCDIEAGNINGGITIGVTYGFGNENELKGAHFVVDNLEDLENTILDIYDLKQ